MLVPEALCLRLFLFLSNFKLVFISGVGQSECSRFGPLDSRILVPLENLLPLTPLCV